MKKLTHEYLKNILKYNPNTGDWIWLITKNNNSALKNQKAGTINSVGYRVICIDKKFYLSSRLAWFYMTGKWPLKQMDHKDTNRSNDIWDNLRLATNGQNTCNQKIRIDNKTGTKGVFFRKDTKKYSVRVTIDNKKINLGCYNTLEEARAVRQKAANNFHGEFVRHA